MAIAILCPHCKVRLKVADDRAGDTLECPRCDKSISIPIPLPSVEEEPAEEAESPIEEYRRRKQRRRHLSLFIAVAILFIFAAGAAYFFRFRGDSTRFSLGVGNSLSRFNNIDEFVADMRSKPEFSSVALLPSDLPKEFVAILPRNHDYECAVVSAGYTRSKDRGVSFIIYDLTSHDLAIKFRKSLVGILNDESKQLTMISGQFLITAMSRESADWFRANYDAE